MSRKISEIMTKQVIAAAVDDSLFDVANTMKDHDIGFLPILDGTRLVGVVTDRDLVTEGYANRKSDNSPVRDVMTRDCVYVSQDTSINDAVEIMSKEQIRRLCVVNNEELVGICALADIAVHDIYQNEAGEAISNISSPSKEQYLHQ